jgi:hypothetical protein
MEIFASFLEYRELPIQVHKAAAKAERVGMKARMYLRAKASSAYLAIKMARITPLLTLSRSE